MKKLICVSVILMITIGLMFADFTIKTGFNFPGKMKAEIKNAEEEGMADPVDTKMGFLGAAEYSHAFSSVFSLGAGVQIETGRTINPEDEEFDAENFKHEFNPTIYALTKVCLTTKGCRPYLTGHLGYNGYTYPGEKDLDDMFGNVTVNTPGGIYTGLGAGINMGKFQIELLHTIHRGDIDISHEDYEEYLFESSIAASCLTTTIGYNF